MSDDCYNTFEGATPYVVDDRDFSQFSDHVTVWLDQHIGVQNTYEKFKAKFNDNIQILQSNNLQEMELDDYSILCTDQALLKKLSEDVYCLKYFSTVEECLNYINSNTQKRIFFISSGSMGKKIVPQIANLTQIQCIYIFCGNISSHTEWASEYADVISGMLEHQDNLLERLAGDIATYLEEKGDKYKHNDERLKASNCYAWTKKLFTRAQTLGSSSARKSAARVTEKIAAMESSATCTSEE